MDSLKHSSKSPSERMADNRAMALLCAENHANLYNKIFKTPDGETRTDLNSSEELQKELLMGQTYILRLLSDIAGKLS